MNTLLFVTDLYYEAKGRNYYEEDLFLTSKLREDFQLVICHPEDTETFEKYNHLSTFSIRFHFILSIKNFSMLLMHQIKIKDGN